jgi:hypothetical protein
VVRGCCDMAEAYADMLDIETFTRLNLYDLRKKKRGDIWT